MAFRTQDLYTCWIEPYDQIKLYFLLFYLFTYLYIISERYSQYVLVNICVKVGSYIFG